MRVSMALAVIPRAVLIVLSLLLVAAFAAGAFVIGAQPSPKLPSPTGPAGNGLIALGLDGDVWVMRADGTDRRRLTSDPDIDSPGIWSPDGTRFAFWSVSYDGDIGDDAAVEAAFAAPNNKSVKVIRSDGSEARTLASGLNWPLDCSTDLTWSPDSREVAYAHVLSGKPRIDVASVDGGDPRMLITDGQTPTWSPDGTTIAILTTSFKDPTGGPFESPRISLVEVDGSGLRRLTETRGSGCAFQEPQWSPDGSHITFYDNADGLHDIWVANTDGSGEVRTASDPADEYWPRWSPDGTRIAFDRVVMPTINAPQFVLTDPDGTNQLMLDHPPVASRYPTWSPDGTLLLGMTLNASNDGTDGLMLIDVTGAAPPVTIETGRIFGDPSWQRLAP